MPLPDKIKCGRCQKSFGHAKYSTKQLTDARYMVKMQGRITTPINCTGCTSGVRKVELECVKCGKTKGMDDFAKSQRSVPDTATCYKCTEIHLDIEPVAEEYDPDKAFVVPDHSGGVYPDYHYASTAATHSTFVGFDNLPSYSARY